ncbi:OmpW/AlkL family protein [Coralloluteibacterium stylophorae]|uniref:Outer membrane beta-barrel protein n=1 Tax=Coralloluteibacterium stylophorae TaxID=1776034 RepID=A0A8J7VUT0_9GAMM|nr:OmpW family outer membrane protein [Coralloluteibacterium stylophorae]MBS7458000.1 outer membrane beta-barrel protein [Coralloluteibacterium stylophorae]
MKAPKILALAAAAALVAPALASAQDRSDMWSYGAGSGKHFAVVGSFAHMDPKSDIGAVAGSQADVDGDGAATASFSWFFNDYLALELWGAADKFGHDVELDGQKAATLDSQPLALSAQFHYPVNEVFSPFVGVGYHQTNYDNEEGTGALAGSRIGLSDGQGVMGTVGVDMHVNDTWFVRTDARYLRSRSDVAVDGVQVASDAHVDPWIYSVGIGARF